MKPFMVRTKSNSETKRTMTCRLSDMSREIESRLCLLNQLNEAIRGLEQWRPGRARRRALREAIGPLQQELRKVQGCIVELQVRHRFGCKEL